MTEPEKPPVIIDHTDVYAEFFGKIVQAGVTGGADLTGKVLELVGRTIEAVGRAATALDPLQFLFVAGTALVALNYFDTTEPYATIIRKLRLHGLILLLHAPGTSANDTQKFLDAVKQCIKEHDDAGVPIPPVLGALSTASNWMNIGHLLEQIIPGAGILDTFLTGLFNAFNIRTASQILNDTLSAFKEWCKKDVLAGAPSTGTVGGPGSIPPDITTIAGPGGLQPLPPQIIGHVYYGSFARDVADLKIISLINANYLGNYEIEYPVGSGSWYVIQGTYTVPKPSGGRG